MRKRMLFVLMLVGVAVVALYASGSLAAKPARVDAKRPADKTLPKISGTAVLGSTLHASSGRWRRAGKLAYEWKRCNARGKRCKAIRRPKPKKHHRAPRANQYKLTRADLGHTIRVTVTASNRFGHTAATSARTAVIKLKATPAPVPAPAPAPAPTTGGGGTPAPTAAGLHVAGHQLLNSSGQAIQLHGVDRSGTDYACEQKIGFTDGVSGDTEFSPMPSWHINTVVLGINQDCWLGINGVPAQYAGQNYINFIKSEVASMEKYGIYPTLSFFVGEPGSDTPNWYSTGNGNAPMPNNDHVPLVWEEIANTFKGDPNVIFRLYEEPYPKNNGVSLDAWKCWSHGDVQYSTSSDHAPPQAPTPSSTTGGCSEQDSAGHSYQTVGMQSLINIIRGAGATNVIQVPGVAFANMMACSNTGSPTQCGFLDSADGVRLSDPLSASAPQLMADVDLYPDNGQYCDNVTCYTDTFGPVAAAMPFEAGEIGITTSNGPMTQTVAALSWLNTNHAGYYGFTWDTWGPLINNYNGTAKAPWGTYYQSFLAQF